MKTASEVGTSLVSVEAEEGEAAHLPFWLSPRHQQHNAAMALAIMESLAADGHLERAKAAWCTARDTTLWPARFEVLRPSPLLEGQRLVRATPYDPGAVGGGAAEWLLPVTLVWTCRCWTWGTMSRPWKRCSSR